MPFRPCLIPLLLIPVAAHAQAVSTASRLADVQAGITFTVANSDYTNSISNPSSANDVFNLAQPTGNSVYWKGYGAYANLDLRYHYGLELSYHHASSPGTQLSESTIEFGPRYIFHVGRFSPYAKALYGRGLFNFAAYDANGNSVQIANVGYNVLTAGGGLDLKLRPGLNLRLFDYEYQHWLNFPPSKLNPQVLSFGVAYHFHGGLYRRRD